MKIAYSGDIKTRNIKLLFWGASGSRKTETILRHFPKVFLIDTEGNSDMCIGMEEIPPFMQAKTKDPGMILQLIEELAAGKHKFPDGALPETIAIDSVSPLWEIQKDVVSRIAEKRALSKRRSAEEASISVGDWNVGKRPLKRIYTMMDGSPFKYLILTARAKDLFEDLGGGNLKKIGMTFDAMKGIEYEVNLALEMRKGTPWTAHVTKVQGKLGRYFPEGSVIKEFPTRDFWDFCATVQPKAEMGEDEEQIAENQVKDPHTKEELIAVARQYGIEVSQIGPLLEAAGLTFDPARWDEMVAALKNGQPA